MKVWLLILALAASGCAHSTSSHAASNGSWPCDDAGFLSVEQSDANGASSGDKEVDICGKVTRVSRARRTRSGTHGYFDVAVSPNLRIEVVCNLDEMDAPAWPWVHVGDYSYVEGRYYFDSAYRQGIDWTHHGTSYSWPHAGYVVVNGTEYQ